ncbi:MAG: zf-TFIIB domain-containing protein [Myxococcales bacterium]|nr:zf-TFIIB domain-containing protein [Myxococcales bacterium]
MSMERSCPACDGKLVRRDIGGVGVEVCSGCDSVLVERDDVLRLRDQPAEHDPLLRRIQPPPGAGDPVWAAEPRDCPDCRQKMTSFTYRGGSTVVERCAGCDKLFFEHGELGKVLYEWDHGLEMSEDARTMLDGYKEQGLYKRMHKLDALAGSAALVAGYITLRILQLSGHVTSWYAIVPALLIGAGYFAYRVRHLKRAKQRVQRRLENHQLTTRPAAAAASAKPSAKATTCPWCGATVPPKTTRCLSCDSDIF